MRPPPCVFSLEALDGLEKVTRLPLYVVGEKGSLSQRSQQRVHVAHDQVGVQLGRLVRLITVLRPARTPV